jgi:hypothetical protein
MRTLRLYLCFSTLTCCSLAMTTTTTTTTATSTARPPMYSATSATALNPSNPDTWSRNMGESALQQVQWIGQRVAFKQDEDAPLQWDTVTPTLDEARRAEKVDGTGGSIFLSSWRELWQYRSPPKQQQQQVWRALANLEQDSKCSVSVCLVYTSIFQCNHSFIYR